MSKLKKSQAQALKDLAAYISLQADSGKTGFKEILFHVSHDVGGLVSDDPHFVPRTDGWEEVLKKKAKAS